MFDGMPSMSAIITGITPWVSPLWTEFTPIIYAIIGITIFGFAFWILPKLLGRIFGD